MRFWIFANKIASIPRPLSPSICPFVYFSFVLLDCRKEPYFGGYILKTRRSPQLRSNLKISPPRLVACFKVSLFQAHRSIPTFASSFSCLPPYFLMVKTLSYYLFVYFLEVIQKVIFSELHGIARKIHECTTVSWCGMSFFSYLQTRNALWAVHVHSSVVYILLLFNHSTDLNQVWKAGSLEPENPVVLVFPKYPFPLNYFVLSFKLKVILADAHQFFWCAFAKFFFSVVIALSVVLIVIFFF